MSKTFNVVTCSSGPPREPYYCYAEFIASLARYGHRPIILGSGPGEFRGLGSKPKLLRKAILDGTVASTHMIFCDCFDLVFAVSPESILGRWEDFGSPWVSSAELNCFPLDQKEIMDLMLPDEKRFRYLNSGFIVCETEAMVEVLRRMDLDNVPEDHRLQDGNMFHVNDQLLFQQQYIIDPIGGHSLNLQLDSDCILNQTLCGCSADDFDMTGPRIKNKITDSFPMSFHFNGPAKTAGLREPILAKLGL